MHSKIYKAFERICSERKITGSVLEVGAVPSKESLLALKVLDGATEKVGINLDGPYEFQDFKIVKGNANAMDCFEDEQFDAVLCNATLEHDKYFWKTVAEIKRVTKPGGIVIIGVPGYREFPRLERMQTALKRIPFIRRLNSNQRLNMFFTATITFRVHDAPGDYYRFSRQAFQEVFFEGMTDVEVESVMLPPRLIGVGFKSADAAAKV